MEGRILRESLPHLQIISRAWDIVRVFELIEHGVCDYERETFEGAYDWVKRH